VRLRDVTHRGNIEVTIFGLDGTQRDLDRKQCAVGAQAGEFLAAAHRPQARVGDEMLPMLMVDAAHAFGHQRFHGQRAQLGCRIAEQVLGLRIGEDDAASCVGNDHCIRRQLEQSLERGWMQGGSIVHRR